MQLAFVIAAKWNDAISGGRRAKNPALIEGRILKRGFILQIAI